MAITAPFVHPMTGHLPHPDPARLPSGPGPGPRTLKRQTDSRNKYAPEQIVASLLAFRRFPPATATGTRVRMEQAPGAVANVSLGMTSYLPSPADLLMVVPRLLNKASSLSDVLRTGGSVIAEPTAANSTNTTLATAVGKLTHESLAAAAAAASATAAGAPDDISMLQVFKNVASFFSYVTSKWAIGTFAVVSRRAPVETRHG
jgi:hypothetical protein